MKTMCRYPVVFFPLARRMEKTDGCDWQGLSVLPEVPAAAEIFFKKGNPYFNPFRLYSRLSWQVPTYTPAHQVTPPISLLKVL